MTEVTHQGAITGIGEVPVRRDPSRSVLDIAVTAAQGAMADAGLENSDIDAVLMAPCFADPWFNADLSFGRLMDELALRQNVRMSAQVSGGGSTGEALLRAATGLIASGEARNILCVHAEKFTNMSDQAGFDFFATAGTEHNFEAPYGMLYNAIPALAARRYMFETGTTLEQIGHISVSCREWASLNPNALYREKITIDDVMASREIVSPLRSLMLNVIADGGSAFVVSPAADAASITPTPVYVWGHGDAMNRYSFAQNRDITDLGWAEAGAKAYAAAGVTASDIDVAEIYVAYPIFNLMALEGLGFFERGHAGEFAATGGLGPGGSLPMNTNGGTMSYGHTGAGVGVAFLVESCRQLMGKAGERQVPDIEVLLKTGCGGAYYDAHVTILGREAR
jgi:acetyl-CoA C-acetyltransferase